MIDIRELRKDPNDYRARLSRKGADGLVDQLLEADAAWRAATAIAESLRSKLKLSGKPTPEQLQELQRAKEQLQESEASESTQSLMALPRPADHGSRWTAIRSLM